MGVSVNIGVKKALTKDLGLKSKEKFLVITDRNKLEIAKVFLQEARKITKNSKLMVIPVSRISGQEPSKKAAAEMLKADVIALVTTKSFTHTIARKNACKKGARVASMPGITREIIEQTFGADIEKMFELGKRITKVLEKTDVVRVKSAQGTDISMKIRGRKIHRGDGSMKNKGDFGNLPGSEVAVSPLEGSANGKIVFDASMASIGKLRNPIELIVKNGYVVEINGKQEAKQLKTNIKGLGKNARNIAELGIGTNPDAKIVGIILEDEKVLGTVHMAIGDSYSIGGKVVAGCHLDGVILKPTVICNRKIIMRDGKLLI